MGWFSDIFGSDDKKKEKTSSSTKGSSSTERQKAEESASINKTQSATEASQQNLQTGGSTTQNLSDANRQALDELIARAASKDNIFGDRTSGAVDAQIALGNTLAGRVGQQGQNLDAMIAAQQEAAKLNFAENQGAQISQFQDNVGSSMNTTVQLLKQKGDRELAVQLASLDATTRLQARQLDNQENAIATDAIAKGAEAAGNFDAGQNDALTNALNALTTQKGTLTSTLEQLAQSGVQSSNTNTQAVLQELLKSLETIDTEESSSSVGKGSASGSSTPGIGTVGLSLLDILSR